MSRRATLDTLRRDYKLYAVHGILERPTAAPRSADAEKLDKALCSKFLFDATDLQSSAVPREVYDRLNNDRNWDRKKDERGRDVPGGLGYYLPSIDAGESLWRMAYRHERSRVDLEGKRDGQTPCQDFMTRPTSGWIRYHFNAFRFIPCWGTPMEQIRPREEDALFELFKAESGRMAVAVDAWWAKGDPADAEASVPKAGEEDEILAELAAEPRMDPPSQPLEELDLYHHTREGLGRRFSRRTRTQKLILQAFEQHLRAAKTYGRDHHPSEEEREKARVWFAQVQAAAATLEPSQESAGGFEEEDVAPLERPGERQQKAERAFESLCHSFIGLCVDACNRVLEWKRKRSTEGSEGSRKKNWYCSFASNADSTEIKWTKGPATWSSINDGCIRVSRKARNSQEIEDLVEFPVVIVEAKKGTKAWTDQVVQMAGELLAAAMAGFEMNGRDIMFLRDDDLEPQRPTGTDDGPKVVETRYGLGCQGWHMFIIRTDYKPRYFRNLRDHVDLPADHEDDFVRVQVSQLFNLDDPQQRAFLFDEICRILCFCHSEAGQRSMRVMRMFGPDYRRSAANTRRQHHEVPRTLDHTFQGRINSGASQRGSREDKATEGLQAEAYTPGSSLSRGAKLGRSAKSSFL